MRLVDRLMPSRADKNWVRIVIGAIADPKGKRSHITLEDFAAKVGAGAELVRKWSAGANPGFEYSQEIRKLFPREAALADEAVGIPRVSDPAGNMAPVTKSRLGEALDAELARRNAAAHANALEMVLKMEKLGQPLSDEQLRAVAASLLDDVPADAGRGSRK